MKTLPQNIFPELFSGKPRGFAAGFDLYTVDKNQKHRKITFYKSYFQEFFDKQSKKVIAKIVWTFELVEDLQ